jgi:LPXTG-motif cell wall-anchored protein
LKNKTIKKVFAGLLATSAIFVAGKVHANEFSFSVNPVLPANQAVPNVSYYDLLLNPGQTQTVEVTLMNGTDKEVTVNATLASATTNLNGVVEYGKNAIKPDPTLKYDIAKFGNIPSKIELAAHETKQIPVTVTMPDASFDGVIAGGLTFKQDASQVSASASDKKGISIKNEFQYVVAFLMQQSQNVPAPDLHLNGVTAAQVNYRNVINANYQNSAMNYLKNMVVDSSVYVKGSNKAVYNTTKTMMQMAPNSNFEMPLALNGQAFKPGTYTYKSTVYGYKDPSGQYVYQPTTGAAEHYDYKWTFEKDFTISGQQAQALNKKDVSLPHPANNTWIYLLIGALVLIILLLIFFILFKRRKKDDEEKETTK